MRTRAEQKAATRGRLLDAAAVLVAAKGVEGATVDAIAAEAGVTTGALYASFRTKRELLKSLVEERQEDVSGIPLETLAEDIGERWEGIQDDDPITARLLRELLAAAWRDDVLREVMAEALTGTVARLESRIEQEDMALRLEPHDAALLLQVLAAGTISLKPVLGEALPASLLTKAVALMRAEQ
jgi:AcrR family transcriptional regulator